MIRIIWNKNNTKIKLWTTISDGFVGSGKFEKPEYYLDDPNYGDIILREIYNICPCCKRELD